VPSALYPFQKEKEPGVSRRVVVTGAGIVTGLGNGWKTNAEGFRTGRPAFAPVSLFDTSRHRTKIAAQAAIGDRRPAALKSTKHWDRLDRGAQLLLLAADEAFSQASWPFGVEASITLGTTSGGMATGQEFFRRVRAASAPDRRQPGRVVQYLAQQQPLELMRLFGVSGPVNLIANACASGANAIGHAWELVRAGRSRRAVTGGYDALSELVFTGFDSLQALSPTPCRPFDASRDGLSLGEGAAVLTLETLEDASSRGAEIIGEITGYGAGTDCHHLTQPHPRGDAAFRSMSLAAESAGVAPGQIDYVNAHGTATRLNDEAEAEALNRWLGDRAPQTPVSSTKSDIGHLLGAAGAVEAVVCLMALQGGWIPPSASTATPDPVCRFPVQTTPRDTPICRALSNSFGFGGANATLILQAWR
jgi:3-oxoacyl-[acyl-carrier-protein] synthase II